MLRLLKSGPVERENPRMLSQMFLDWHWGTPHDTMKRINDPRLPTHLVECGRVVQFEIEVPDNTASTGSRILNLTVPKAEQKDNHLAFDPDHRSHRLYVVMSDRMKKETQKIYQTNSYAATPLKFWAKIAGGRHAKGDYPDIQVKPLGILYTSGYSTTKLPDGPTWYKHMMGEETGIRPILTVAEDGTLWLAGGDYTSPTPGITN